MLSNTQPGFIEVCYFLGRGPGVGALPIVKVEASATKVLLYKFLPDIGPVYLPIQMNGG